MAQSRQSDSFQSIAQIIAADPALKTVREMVERQQVLDQFHDLFPQFRELVMPVKLQKNVLTLAVENAVLRSELKFRESELIAKINNHFSGERVSKIKFQA